MALVEIGQPAPEFSLPDQSGTRHSLADYRGRPVVLYFYPKDDTAGCTAEACDFRDAVPDLSRSGAAVLGVSPDDAKSHAKFVSKYGLNFPLLADVSAGGDPPTCAAYGVWGEKSMYGRKYMGVIRTTYLVDGEGVVRRRWDSVKVPGHVEEVAAAVDALRNGGDVAAASASKVRSPRAKAASAGSTKTAKPSAGKKTTETAGAKEARSKPKAAKTVSKKPAAKKSVTKRSKRQA